MKMEKARSGSRPVSANFLGPSQQVAVFIKIDEFYIRNDGFRVKTDEFCIQNDEFNEMISRCVRLPPAGVAGSVGLRCDELCIKNDEICIKNDEICIKNDEICIKYDEFCIKMMDFV